MAQKENPLKIRCLLLALLLVLCCTGCAAPEKKVFEIKEMRLTLDDSFKEGTLEIYTGILKSNREAIGVIVLREDKSQLPDTIKTADDYAELTRSATVQSGRTIDEIKHDGDIPYYEYNFRSELNYRYYTAHFESEDAFWGVQFFCAKNRYDKNFAVFSEWAHAITFAD